MGSQRISKIKYQTKNWMQKNQIIFNKKSII